ncbi:MULTISPECIES: entry exclusion lipoprotein TrbK [Burkholderiales]|jgi:entry exclusion lipoprotein TrbK|uniref:Entry exclusion lipoprotein TrbK n=1 Tax=Delftia acidovorans TaxID=80866 RepID=A0A7T2RYZ9_DELAC|nr:MULTISPECIES: entry exclusion lipoprotein TrbK [Burkholderiales]ABM44407.1 putative entry/exclusion protein TrbK [Acidovorax sp. JS42]QPS05739.1 entry exclusion lipoprotein TrbK [Delftia acidovorans]HEB4994711.1 entry exclusion lipoprotein TrbK [Aeromonas hydrophila subsp. hydrophila]
MKKALLLAVLAAALLAGCDSKPTGSPMPEVNDANCQIEAIKRIEDRATRESFAGLCARRSPAGGGIAPTENPKNWLELIDKNTPKGQEAKP